MNPVIPRDPATPTADVSCPECGTGWWVTNPDRLPWTGCEDCAEEEGTVALTDLDEAWRGVGLVLLVADSLATWLARLGRKGVAR